MKTEQYRLDTAFGKLYEFDADQNAYIFVSATNCKKLSDAVQEYEEYLLSQDS